MLIRDVRDPGVRHVTVTRVRMTKDCSTHASTTQCSQTNPAHAMQVVHCAAPAPF